MNKRKIITLHLITWIVLSLIFFISSESLTKYILSGIHDVTIWLTVLATGLALIFIAVTISLAIKLKAAKK